MINVTVKVDGMSCDACVRHVTKALADLPGVLSVDVKLAEGEALLGINPDVAMVPAIVEAIEDQGYEAHVADQIH